jgi:D-3-phosphoglycerate dehydrogenase / 2-oxoglutarate reductase
VDILVVEPIDSAVLHWLAVRHALRFAPELAADPLDFRDAIGQARALIIPPSVSIDGATLLRAPQLRVIGRLSAGPENIDLEACSRAGVEVVRPATAAASAEAEFVVGALLQLLRRVPVFNDEGLLVGRELGSATVGIVGAVPASRPLVHLLGAFGARLLGYDAALHVNDPSWAASGLQPVGLRELVATSDAVCVLMGWAPRFSGLFGERLLAHAKPNQVIVSLTHSALFNEGALAEALSGGRLAAAWLDSVEPGLMDPGRPLRHIDTLQVTPRIAATTRESRVRSAWAVARRIDELLLKLPPQDAATDDESGFSSTLQGALAGSADDPPTA